MSPRFLALVCSLVLAIGLGWSSFSVVDAQTAGSAAQQPSPSATHLTDNPDYEKRCAHCHGKNAEGKHLFGGPSLVSGKVTGMPQDDLIQMITNGKGHMPKFKDKLSAEQIETLATQIKAAEEKGK